jgi:hypothetical protein
MIRRELFAAVAGLIGGKNKMTDLNYQVAHAHSDVNGGPYAIHHNLGPGPNQASPGNHTHDGATSKFPANIAAFVAADLTLTTTTPTYTDAISLNIVQPGLYKVTFKCIAWSAGLGIGLTSRWDLRNNMTALDVSGVASPVRTFTGVAASGGAVALYTDSGTAALNSNASYSLSNNGFGTVVQEETLMNVLTAGTIVVKLCKQAAGANHLIQSRTLTAQSFSLQTN